MKIGIDLGGSHIGIGVVNEKGEILEKNEISLNKNEINDMEKYVITHILENIAIFSNKYLVEAIGIASPGTPKEGKITNLVNLGIKQFDITNAIQSKYKIPVIIKNDAKCAAIAEKNFGSLKKYKDCIFICLGSGIGGAVFMGNKELVPNKNPGMEFGHMIIEKNGELCNCGKRGCFETYCSIKRLKNRLIRIMELEQNISGQEFIEILKERKDEQKIKQILDEYIDNLIIGLSNIIDIFEPEVICFGGSFVYFEEILYKQLEEKFYLAKYVFNKETMPELKLATLKNDAGIIGAVCE